MKKYFFIAFPALVHKNYRIYLLGHFISIAGSWLQIVAQGWLVYQLTNSAFLVGLASAINTLPILLFSVFGGVLIDRFPKQRVIMITSLIAMVLSLIYGILTLTNNINFTVIAVVAFFSGLVDSIDKPARKSFLSELVGKEDLSSAIALNSSTYNAARVVGPAIAGVLIATVGAGMAFIFNAVSYLVVAIILLFLKSLSVPKIASIGAFDSLKQGLSYAWTHGSIRNMLALVGVLSIFGWSYLIILPVIAERVFHLDATGLGYLYAASGVGATLGALIVSALGNRITPGILVWTGSLMLAISMFFFTLTQNLTIALIMIFLTGLGITLVFSMLNTLIQKHTDDTLRGRIMALYTLMLNGLAPFGSFQVGWLAENYGSPFALQIGAGIILIVSVTFLLFSPSLKRALNKNPQYT